MFVIFTTACRSSFTGIRHATEPVIREVETQGREVGSLSPFPIWGGAGMTGNTTIVDSSDCVQYFRLHQVRRS